MTKVTKRTGRPRKTTGRVTKTLPFNTMDDVAVNVNTVLHSLINQDGRYKIQEATAISKIYGNQLAFAKLKLDVHKLHTKTSDTSNYDDILSLT